MPETTRVADRPPVHPTGTGRPPALVYAVAAVSALGGLLFGYDTGIISGALLHLRDDLDLSSREQEVVVSVILLGAMAGALVSGRTAVRHGRRKVVVAVAVIFAVGAVAAAVAPDVATLIAARFVLGLAVGGASNMVPVYIAELAPAAVRGRLMVLFQLMVAIGQLIAYLCGWALAGSGGWRVMFALAVIPAVALAVGMLFLPESPRWLIEQHRADDALRTLRRLRPTGADVAAEAAEVTAVTRNAPADGGSWGQLRQRWLRPALLIAVGIAAFSQLTGINAIVYYAPTILDDAGFGDSVALLTGIGIGAMLVVAGVVGAIAVDKAGRRRTMLWFLPGSALAMAVLALAFATPAESAAQRWTVIISLFAYILFNGVGMQAVVWLIGPEVLPLSVRGPATSLATLSVWGFDLLIAMTALTAINTIGRSGTFLFYALMNVACVVFVAAKVPETKGRSLESIERALRDPLPFRRALEKR
ncbi:sugar porter family MFS transporter [Streptomyces alfalfae]|uniref:sugar porter family MFS transporter n=1 Tax=Streptomyces alfalfae TaxID=1642299 RepID=UPI0009A2279D|nr:sugar porter family MFS transporter [Streptomyces alfalfae]AYA15278.1 sugar porter family MFS transporter [Streptomyces fradiae]RXX34968.1 sugar porter family MFS transporter [Streptomyces alfalfae]RXX45825.1 sugar porter family MFS transporter [Streptomyces alfalfae]RXX47960.1 sugar porter family MFS transporter [Streptomyces alfalfae]RZN01758.1 sugar porter family MFS transporter [Streptomyces alfalfae]